MNSVNTSGPRTEPCGTPLSNCFYNNVLQLLSGLSQQIFPEMNRTQIWRIENQSQNFIVIGSLNAVSVPQRRLSGSGEDERRHRGVQEGDGRLVRHAGPSRHVECISVQQPGATSCGEGHGGIPQICECLRVSKMSLNFSSTSSHHRTNLHQTEPVAGLVFLRRSSTTTMPSTQSTVCVRC